MDGQNDGEMARVSVRMPRKVWEALRKLAEEDKRSVNAEIVWMVETAIRVAREDETDA